MKVILLTYLGMALSFLLGIYLGGMSDNGLDHNVYYLDGYNQALHDCINNTYAADTLITYKRLNK